MDTIVEIAVVMFFAVLVALVMGRSKWDYVGFPSAILAIIVFHTAKTVI